MRDLKAHVHCHLQARAKPGNHSDPGTQRRRVKSKTITDKCHKRMTSSVCISGMRRRNMTIGKSAEINKTGKEYSRIQSCTATVKMALKTTPH